MKQVRFYIKIYIRYFSQSLKRRLAYRSDFLIQIIFALSTQVASLVFVLTIFEHIPDLNGWSFAEILFIYGFAQTAMALFSFFFGNLISLGRYYILNGQLDRVLLRPLHPLFQILVERLDFGALSTLGMGLGALGYACALLNLSWSITTWFLLVSLLFCAALLFAGLVFILV
ncbi:TPA: ABC transporter permease, partial [Candidatus Poribacteria bacterium]|nr:ABC transporter permease [Candidatus Poribacteria bacterium]